MTLSTDPILTFASGWGWDSIINPGNVNADSRLQGTVTITPEIMIPKCFKLLERKVTWKHTQGHCDPWDRSVGPRLGCLELK